MATAEIVIVEICQIQIAMSGREPVVVVWIVQVVTVHRIEAREQDLPLAAGVHAFQQHRLGVKVCSRS